MSDEGKFVGDSLEDLLVSLADGVREAQRGLSVAPAVDEFGRQIERYHFPYIDFEFEVAMDTVNSSERGRTFLKIRPKGSSSTTATIRSLLTGRLVAVPPGEGLPRPLVDFASERKSARRFTIQLTASNDAGELLTGHEVELNLNFEASHELSALAGVSLTPFTASTRLEEAILVTDDTGTATTELALSNSIPAKSVIVVTAEMMGESHNHAVRFDS